MDISQKPRLIDAYRRYGFHLARDRAAEGVLVFTLKTGYFDNAEIVKLNQFADTKTVFDEFSRSGYACTVRDATSPEQAEEELFRGFFSVEVTRRRLLDDYRRFSSNLVAPYGPNAEYTYIKVPYQINGKEGLESPPQEVLNRISDPQPILFLIEAAAGFGKTCTALEIVKLLAGGESHIPLYAELSRNRQARIFRYILLDEIDRTFPLLSSSLVQTEIKNGRVATILDGFDELLRKNESTGEFENTEPMLETVSEMLTGRAKVIITTRRTVLFDGDEFHQWLERHAESFKVIRIRLQEPRVNDWLNSERLARLSSVGLEVEAIANPVLLSYLRCIDEAGFVEATRDSETVVDSYFSYMLDRERHRQDLRMNIEAQAKVLKFLAQDMVNVGYTAEARDYIVDFILNKQAKLIDETRAHYPASEKPTREEIANKLASHALLDRSPQDSNKIGFVNEFALGNFVAENILSEEDWISDDMRFIEPAVRSYAPRSEAYRLELYKCLGESLPYLDIGAQIEISAELLHSLPFDISDGEAEGLLLEDIEVGSLQITGFLFNECTFRRCSFNRQNLVEVTFLNCRFYDCHIQDGSAGGAIHVLGGSSSPDITGILESVISSEIIQEDSDPESMADSIVLKRFWPIGESPRQRPSRPIYKPVKYLCKATENASSAELYKSVERLKRRGLLIEMNKSGLMTLNYEFIVDIQAMLLG